MQFDQGLCYQPKLLRDQFDLVFLATSHSRPAIGCCRNPLACLLQHCRIETPKTHHVIVNQRHALHTVGLLHGLEYRASRLSGVGLGAEKQQILQQA